MRHYLKEAIRLSNYLSWGNGGPLFANQRSYPSFVLLCHRISPCVCSKEWQSEDVVLIYWMVARKRIGMEWMCHLGIT